MKEIFGQKANNALIKDSTEWKRKNINHYKETKNNSYFIMPCFQKKF